MIPSIDIFYRFNGKEYVSVEQYDKEIREKEKEIERLNKCYCNRSDCAGRLNQKNEVYDSVVQRNEKAIEYLEKADDNENSYGDYEIHYEVKKELLDILKGVDKE